MMIPLNLNKIQTYLKSKDIVSELQKETNQLCILLKMLEREYPLFIRIYEGSDLLQLLAFLPCNTKQSTHADTARLLHLINREIDIPGFGMDENADVVFYRCMMISKDKEIDEKTLDAYMNAIQVVCQSFAAVVAGVAYGAITFDDVLAQAKNNNESLTQTFLKRD
jgi:hypothetical protein